MFFVEISSGIFFNTAKDDFLSELRVEASFLAALYYCTLVLLLCLTISTSYFHEGTCKDWVKIEGDVKNLVEERPVTLTIYVGNWESQFDADGKPLERKVHASKKLPERATATLKFSMTIA